MDRHAGFAAAICIRGQTLHDMQRVAYHAGQLSHRLTGTAQGISADFHLDLPVLEFRKADQNQVRLNLKAWGPLTLTLANGTTETRSVIFQTSVLAVPSVGTSQPDPTQAPQLTFALNALVPELVSLSVVPYEGGPFSPEAQAKVESSEFRFAVQVLIGQRLASMSPKGLNAAFLGGIALQASAPVVVVLDGLLAIGIDVFAAQVGDDEITTFGDANLLTDFTEGNDLAVWLNPVAMPLAYQGVGNKVRTKVEEQGASLDLYSFWVEEGWFRIGGQASKSSGTVTFSMKAVPKLYRPAVLDEWDDEYGEHFVGVMFPERHELWFDMQDVEVDVDLSWWAAALASLGTLLSLGIGYFIVKALMDVQRGNTANAFEGESNASQAAVIQEFTLPGTTEPKIRTHLRRFECHEEGVFIGSTITVQFPSAQVTGTRSIAAEAALTDEARYRLKLPFDVHSDDPQLRVRWTLRRMDTGEVLVTEEGQAAERLTFRFDATQAPFLQVDKYRVECRVYRVRGGTINDLHNESLAFGIYDPLDRSHPYVRWSHELYTPQVRVESDGSQTILGYAIKGRRSALHRTALPGRCKMVAQYSLQQIREPGIGVTPSVIEYLDDLPFPRENLVQRRAQVCDYCFFGGPSKNVPLIP